MILGALEAGGTKMVCAIGNENGEILEQVSIPTETPEITIPKLLDFFRGKQIEALGIGCFGPIDVDRDSETYGYITTTPKLAWQNYNIVGAFKKELGVPVGFDTDVNGSALGEYTWGIAKGLHSCIYITIGTGVGVGVIVDGNLVHGMMHPEGGHVLLSRLPEDAYKGFCPFHENCMEGLAAGHQTQPLPMVRAKFKELLNGYIRTKEIEDLDSYIVVQSLDDKQGIMGALKLGMMELERQR